MELFGVRLLGISDDTERKLLFSVGFVTFVVFLRIGLVAVTGFVRRRRKDARAGFWMQQGTNLLTAALLIVGLVSIWFDDPERLTTALGLFSAGLAFALQKVVTSVAAYFVILRSRAFTVGDRILMGGVRGDVIQLGFIQTTIMEMGQPPGERPDDPAVWVRSRQFTGRIVTVTNDKIFDEPVFNYTRDFPFIWEEYRVPIPLGIDWRRAEQILLEAAGQHALHNSKLSQDALSALQQQYDVPISSLEPRVYLRITDNWLELTLRFLSGEHGSTEIKDAITREVLEKFERAGIEIASATVRVVGLPEVRLLADDPKSR